MLQQHKKNPVALAKKLLSFGSKLEPLGIVIGQSGTKYDGQAQAKDQRDDQAPVTASHVTQDVDARGATNSNLDVIQQNQDLCVQVRTHYRPFLHGSKVPGVGSPHPSVA